MSDARDEKGRRLADALLDVDGMCTYADQDCFHEDLITHLDTRESELREARAEIERLRDVLRAIRDQDYRGNPCTCSGIAQRAMSFPTHTIHGPHTEGA